MSEGSITSKSKISHPKTTSYAKVVKNLGIQVITPEANTTTFDGIIGISEAKKRLNQIADIFMNKDDQKHSNATLHRKILIYGLNGAGKTIATKAFAKAVNLPLVIINSEHFIDSNSRSETLTNIEVIIKKNSPEVVLFKNLDQILLLGSSISIDVLSKLYALFARYENSFFFGSFNNLTGNPSALLRKDGFTFDVPVEELNDDERTELFRREVNKYPHEKNINLKKLAKMSDDLSPAEIIKNVADSYNEVINSSSDAKRSKLSFRLIESQLSKFLYGYDKDNKQYEKETLATAVHEAGHVICGFFGDPEYVLSKVEIATRSISAGLTISESDESKQTYFGKDLKARIVTLLGGMAAEELVYHDTSTGVTSDLASASTIAMSMVCYTGMTSQFGPFYMSEETDTEDPISKHEAINIARDILKKNYVIAKSLINNHFEAFTALYKTLAEKKYRFTEEVSDILKNPEYDKPKE